MSAWNTLLWSGSQTVSYPGVLNLTSGTNKTSLTLTPPATITDRPSYTNGTATIAWATDHWAISGDDGHYTGSSATLVGTYTGGAHETAVAGASGGGGGNAAGLGNSNPLDAINKNLRTLGASS